MRILIAPDKFKGSMTARQAASLINSGIKEVFPDAETIELPLSDGGEGLVDALTRGNRKLLQQTAVAGPLGEQVTATWGIIEEGNTAVIEMAEASGLSLVPSELRNPSITTTFGTGELIRAALDKGCKKLIIGIGGSATNDGGTGMARALGAVFTDRQGRIITGGGTELLNLEKIDLSGLDKRLPRVKTIIASDVDNPLTGPVGASLIYGLQKGATPEMAVLLDRALQRFAEVVKNDLGCSVAEIRGAGAAGGLGAGLIAFLNAELQPGVDLVLEHLGFDFLLEDCTLIVTGEGKLDQQSLHGKVPIGVARRALKFSVPVIALTGSLEAEPDILLREGITAAFAITDRPLELNESIKKGPEMIKKKTVELMKLWKAAATIK